MLPGLPQRRSFDYIRHGTIDLFAALHTATRQGDLQLPTSPGPSRSRHGRCDLFQVSSRRRRPDQPAGLTAGLARSRRLGPIERGAKLVPAMPRQGLGYRHADEGVTEDIALGVFYQNPHLQCPVQGVEECRIGDRGRKCGRSGAELSE
jgi:hypothetical protein